MEKQIVYISAVIGMLGAVCGIFGGMAFQSTNIILSGLFIWAISLVLILSLAMRNYL